MTSETQTASGPTTVVGSPAVESIEDRLHVALQSLHRAHAAMDNIQNVPSSEESTGVSSGLVQWTRRGDLGK